MGTVQECVDGEFVGPGVKKRYTELILDSWIGTYLKKWLL